MMFDRFQEAEDALTLAVDCLEGIALEYHEMNADPPNEGDRFYFTEQQERLRADAAKLREIRERVRPKW